MNYYQAQYYNDALFHFGVKGMRWGVRKRRETKGRKLKRKQDNVKEKRYVKKAAKQASTKGTKVAIAAIAFGCTALATAWFFSDTAHRDAFKSALKHVTGKGMRDPIKKGDDVLVDVRKLTHKIAQGISPDKGLIIPKGQKISRITGNKNFSLKNHHGGLYAAFSEKDTTFYKLFVNPMDGKDGRHQVLMRNKKDLYIPSRATAENLYRDLMNNDKNYRKDINRAMYRMLYKRNLETFEPEAAGNLARWQVQKIWTEKPNGFYIQNMVMANKGKAYRKYARKLAKAGYDGVLDYHDIEDKLSTAPIIITNKNKLKITKKEKLLF